MTTRAAKWTTTSSFGRDAVVFEYPGPLCARRVHAAHAVLLPGQRHGGAADGKIDVVHDRAFFDLGPRRAGGTANDPDHLLDHQLDAGSGPPRL